MGVHRAGRRRTADAWLRIQRAQYTKKRSWPGVPLPGAETRSHGPGFGGGDGAVVDLPACHRAATGRAGRVPRRHGVFAGGGIERDPMRRTPRLRRSGDPGTADNLELVATMAYRDEVPLIRFLRGSRVRRHHRCRNRHRPGPRIGGGDEAPAAAGRGGSERDGVRSTSRVRRRHDRAARTTRSRARRGGSHSGHVERRQHPPVPGS